MNFQGLFKNKYLFLLSPGRETFSEKHLTSSCPNCLPRAAFETFTLASSPDTVVAFSASSWGSSTILHLISSNWTCWDADSPPMSTFMEKPCPAKHKVWLSQQLSRGAWKHKLSPGSKVRKLMPRKLNLRWQGTRNKKTKPADQCLSITSTERIF